MNKITSFNRSIGSLKRLYLHLIIDEHRKNLLNICWKELKKMSRLNIISRMLIAGISFALFLGLSNVVDALLGISAGGSNTCIILDNEVTKCFGRGGYNGDGTVTNRGNTFNSMSLVPELDWGTDLAPVKISMNSIIEASIYDATTCGIVNPSSPSTAPVLKCFGGNRFGMCGMGRNPAGPNITLGDDPDEIVADFEFLNLGDGLYPVDVAVGGKHACAIVSKQDLTVDRQVKCWGDASEGALGNGATTGSLGDAIEDMGEALPFMTLPGGTKALAIGAGHGFTCVIISASSDDHGDVYCTGNGDFGRTGQESDIPISTPAKVELGDGLTARKIAVGSRHACALIEQDSQIKCWGEGFYSAPGNADNSHNIGDGPTEMGDNLLALDFGGGLTVKEVVAGRFHTCVILSDNKIRCFGGNNSPNGQLGQETSCDRRPSFDECDSLVIDTPAELPITDLGTGVVPISLALGSVHSCALVIGPFLGVKAKCWGSNEYGATGVESGTNYGTGGLSTKMGDNLPFVNSGDPAITDGPSTSPTTSRPSKTPSMSPSTSRPSASPNTSAPSKSPSTSRPSDSPTTSRPSNAPSRTPSRSPTISKSPTLTPTIPITGSPFTQSPTEDAAAATVQQATVIGGAIGGSIVFLLAAFVLFSRRKDICGLLGGSGASKSQVNWLEEAQRASPDAPSTYTLPSGAQTAVLKANKYNAPPMNAQPNLGYERYNQPMVAQAIPVASYESGNPVYAGVAREANVRLSTRSVASAAPPAKPTREQIVEKLRMYYQKVDPNKKIEDINDLATWVMLNSEEALYVKLRKKYGTDPNTVMQTMNMSTVDDVDV